jgi:hypothetical protein
MAASISFHSLGAIRAGNRQGMDRTAYDLLPRIKLTDFLTEVDGWTRFTACFTHLHNSDPTKDKAVLLRANWRAHHSRCAPFSSTWTSLKPSSQLLGQPRGRQILEPGRPNPPTVSLTNYARLLHYRQKQ